MFQIEIQSERIRAIPNHSKTIQKSFCISFDKKWSKALFCQFSYDYLKILTNTLEIIYQVQNKQKMEYHIG